MIENEVLLEISDVTKTYGQGEGITNALKGVTLTYKKGEMLCILGESGSGKSTLLNLIGGLDKPSKGTIKFKGEDISKYNSKELVIYRRDKIGFIFQFFNLLDELNVYQNLTLIPGSDRNKENVNKLLKNMNLKNSINKFPRQLSGGEQQRVSIGRALNKPSEILLADEPTGALDYQTSIQILKLLEKLAREEKKSIIIVTHNVDIAKICDRTITMKSGEIISDKINENIKKVDEISW